VWQVTWSSPNTNRKSKFIKEYTCINNYIDTSPKSIWLSQFFIFKDFYTMRYILNYSLKTYIRLAHLFILCTYSTMAIGISYASTNLPVRGPTSTILSIRSPTSTNLPLVVQNAWTHPVTNLPARNTLKCEHGIYTRPRSYAHTRVHPIWTSLSILIMRSNLITNLPAHNTCKHIPNQRPSQLSMQNTPQAQIATTLSPGAT